MFNQKIRSQILGGAFEDSRNYLSGIYRGFHITIAQAAPQYIIKISAKAPANFDPKALDEYLLQLKSKNKNVLDTAVNNYYIVLAIKSPALIKKLPAVINAAIEPLITYLSDYNYESGCEQCGSITEISSCYEINGECYYICENCAKEIDSALQEHQMNVRSRKAI